MDRRHAGFYWGCNNTKDLELRLETIPSVAGRPANLVFRPSDRDQAWQRLYHKHKGKMGVEFGKEAFTTPPIAAIHSLDAKFTTTDLAKQLKSWALFGPPLGRTWQPTFDERQRYPEIKPLVSNPWTILHGNPPPPAGKIIAVDLPNQKPAADTTAIAKKGEGKRGRKLLNVPAWHGTLLPQTDADIWLAAAFADYERIVAQDKTRGATPADRDALVLDLFAYRSTYQIAAAPAATSPWPTSSPTWPRTTGTASPPARASCSCTPSAASWATRPSTRPWTRSATTTPASASPPPSSKPTSKKSPADR